MAGKTGTAQKVANGHYDPTKWVSSFVGVVPADDPRLVIIVVLDEPQGGHLGGAVAAPIFKEIAEEALRYLHVPPSAPWRPGAEGAARARAARAPASGRSPGMPTRQRAETRRDGTAARRRRAGRRSGAGGKVGRGRGSRGGRGTDAPAEPVTVPDFSGMSLGQAIHAARKSGVELAFDDPRGGRPAWRCASARRPGRRPAAWSAGWRSGGENDRAGA